MRDFKGIPFEHESDPIRRKSLGEVDRFLRDLSATVGKIQNNEIPISNGGTLGVTDHGALTGLGDDDHTQYLLLAGRSGQKINDTVSVLSKFAVGVAHSGTSQAIVQSTSTSPSALQIYTSSGIGSSNIAFGVARGTSTANNVCGLTWDGRFVSYGASFAAGVALGYGGSANTWKFDGTSSRHAIFDFSSTSSSTTRTYTFPDSDGTIALSGGSVNESDITRDSAVYGKLSADDTISGQWTFGGDAPVFNGDDGASRSTIFDDTNTTFPTLRTSSGNSWVFAYVEDSDNINLNIMPFAMDGAPNAAFFPLIFPSAGGDILTALSTNSDVRNKTLTSGTILRTGSVGNVAFAHYLGATQKFIFSAANVSAGSTRVISVHDANATLVGKLKEEVKSNQTAAITTTTLITTPAANPGLYRVSFFAQTTTTADAADTLDTLTIGYTAGSTARTDEILGGSVDLTSSTARAQGSLTIYADVSTTITYATTYTDAGGSTPGAYFLIISVEKI